MRYLGGKQRIGKEIAAIINGFLSEGGTYCEPFCGMLGVGRRIKADARYFSDVHEDLILFLQAIQAGWEPPDFISEEEYKQLRHAEPSALRGFAGFGFAFAGTWFRGYAKDNRGDDYAGAAKRGASKLARDIRNAEIRQLSFTDAPVATVTYCDPPYVGTTAYAQTPAFDSKAFWQWVRERPGYVFVSEYNAPDWVDLFWEKRVSTVSGKGSSARQTEKLFFINNA